MQQNMQFAAIKWIKVELQLSLKQARALLEGVQLNFNNDALERFEGIMHTLSNNLEIANDDVGSILCQELNQIARYIRLECLVEKSDKSVADLMVGLVLLNEHIENISHGFNVDSRRIGVIIDVFRKRQGKQYIQKSLLYVLDISSVQVAVTTDLDQDNKEIRARANDIRPEFQHFLLGWIQGIDRDSSLQRMIDLTLVMHGLANIELVKLYFLASSMVLAGAKDDVLGDERDIKMLFSRMDKQLKLLVTLGEKRMAMGLPLGLVRQTLYFVSKMPSDNERVASLQLVLDLKARLLGSLGDTENIHTTHALASIATEVRDGFKNIKHWLEDIVDHDKPAAKEIDGFIHAAEGWAETLSLVGEQALSKVIADFVRRLAFCIYGASGSDDSQLLVLAEDWLKIDGALIFIQSKSQIGVGDKSHVVDASEEEEQQDVPLNVITAKTTLSDINVIKEIITEDIDGDEHVDVRWSDVNQLLNNVLAACDFIGLDKPAQFIANCRLFIAAVMGSNGYQVNEKEVACIADVVSSVEYLLEDVVNNTSVANTGLSLAESAGSFLASRVNAIQNHQTDQGAEEELPALGGQYVNVNKESDVAADDAAEILEIFIEEAGEICVELLADVARWKADVNDGNTLKDVRRAFHTLKGSGRLANVEFLSETAWPIERMLNDTLDGKLKINKEMVGLVEHFANSLPSWVERINGDQPSLEEMSELVLAADAIEKGELPTLLLGSHDVQMNTFDNTVESVGIESTEELIGSELCGIFSNETMVHLATINQYIEGHAEQSLVLVNHALFRALHTIHGCASMSHIGEVEALSGTLCDYIRELYENNVAVERIDFYSILTEYMNITAQQVERLKAPSVQLLDYQPLQTIISDKILELAGRSEQQLYDEFEEIVGGTFSITEQNVKLDAPPEEMLVEAEQLSAADLLPFAPLEGKPQVEDPLQTDNEDEVEIQAVFVEEGIELLEEISGLFKDWKDNLGDASYLDKALHILHTLKGSSLLVGLNEFGGVIHDVETMLEAYQERNKPFSAPLISTLLTVADKLLVRLQQNGSSEQEAGYSEFISLLNTLNMLEDRAVDEQPLSEQSATVLIVDNEEVQPAPLEKVMKQTVKAREQTVKVSNALLDRLIADVGEVNVSQGQLNQKNKGRSNQIKELTLTIERLRQQLKNLEIETEAQVLFKVDREAEETGFDPLELDRYTHIQQLSRSLLESVSDLEDIRDTLIISDEEIALLIQKESVLTDTLMDDMLRTRVVDFSRYGPRFERLVRQLSKDLGKPTKLVVKGSETEIDRYILNELQAPIEHLIRNAMAHGVDSIEVRTAKDKPKDACITLDLSRDGSEVHLIISDDGSGIDVSKIRDKALKLGHINGSDELTDQSLIQLILKPGFSTRDEVSNLAGRGIGLDIVNDTVSRIGGGLTIHSEKGKGASFHLVFPYTMAINMALMVKTNDVQYGIPNNFIQSVARIPIELLQHTLKQEKPVLEYLGEDYQLHDLSQLLGYGDGQIFSSYARFVPVLLVGSRQGKHAVIVDQLTGNKEVVVKPLSLHLDKIAWLSGSTISGEGNIVLMLDLPVLASLDLPQKAGDAPNAVPPTIRAGPLVMVVDDSITFRKVANKLLTRQGYEVVDARDGMEAVEKLTDIRPDIFLLDVEMPRMDGFELAQYIRRTDGISDRPIVMVSSRTGEKHQRHAKDIGVNSYFGKPFDKELLVASIKGLLEQRYAST